MPDRRDSVDHGLHITGELAGRILDEEPAVPDPDSEDSGKDDGSKSARGRSQKSAGKQIEAGGRSTGAGNSRGNGPRHQSNNTLGWEKIRVPGLHGEFFMGN